MNTGTVVAVMVIVIFLLGPFALIWALNTLFGLTIAYSFSTWLASFILMLTFASKSNTLGK